MGRGKVVTLWKLKNILQNKTFLKQVRMAFLNDSRTASIEIPKMILKSSFWLKKKIGRAFKKPVVL